MAGGFSNTFRDEPPFLSRERLPCWVVAIQNHLFVPSSPNEGNAVIAYDSENARQASAALLLFGFVVRLEYAIFEVGCS